MELGPEDVSLLERCPHFRGWYVQASMELGPDDVSLLERCPHFRGWHIYLPLKHCQWIFLGLSSTGGEVPSKFLLFLQTVVQHRERNRPARETP